MIDFKQTRVYRGDWEFRMSDTEEYFVSDSLYVKNGDRYCSMEHDYMEVEDFNLCLELDDAMYELEYELFGLLADRVYFEYDVNNEVLLTFEEAIKDDWREREDWTDAIDIVKDIKSGKYDDEMKRYYAYLQAVAVMENIDLLDFDDEEGINDSLAINGIYVFEDDLMFRLPGVVESVDRTFDLGMDVIRLLVRVIRVTKNTGETIDFIKGY